MVKFWVENKKKIISLNLCSPWLLIKSNSNLYQEKTFLRDCCLHDAIAQLTSGVAIRFILYQKGRSSTTTIAIPLFWAAAVQTATATLTHTHTHVSAFALKVSVWQSFETNGVRNRREQKWRQTSRCVFECMIFGNWLRRMTRGAVAGAAAAITYLYSS